MNFLKKMLATFNTLKRWQQIVILILILSVVGALAGGSESVTPSASTSPTTTASPTPTEITTEDILNNSSVKWENYSPTVKEYIGELIDTRNCSELQTQFDNADANNAAQQNRTGDSNSALMSFLDEQMRELGCY